AVIRSGAKHPLLDKLRTSWLWYIGKPRAALSFAIRSAKRWQRPYLFGEVALLYAMTGDKQRSEQYFRLAKSLAAQDERKQPLRRTCKRGRIWVGSQYQYSGTRVSGRRKTRGRFLVLVTRVGKVNGGRNQLLRSTVRPWWTAWGPASIVTLRQGSF